MLIVRNLLGGLLICLSVTAEYVAGEALTLFRDDAGNLRR